MANGSIWNRLKSALFSDKAAARRTYPREEVLEWVRDRIRRDIASGYYDSEQIVENARNDVGDELPADVAESEARRLLPIMLAEHVEAQANWPERTDYDRLAAAFSCCGTCGSAEIWDELEAVRAAGGPVSGYTFFHMQDTDSAVDGDDLYLNYGASVDGEDAALAVAHEIVEQLQAHGLQTTWTGSWNQRIGVQLDWKRRLSPDATVH